MGLICIFTKAFSNFLLLGLKQNAVRRKRFV